MIRIVRFLKRSASTPPHGVSSSVGAICTARVMPSHAPELVSSNINQARANFCIQVPMIDTDCPMKKSR